LQEQAPGCVGAQELALLVRKQRLEAHLSSLIQRHGITPCQLERGEINEWHHCRFPFVEQTMAHLTTRALLAVLVGLGLSTGQGAQAQYLYRDSTIRNYHGIIQSGPDPSRLLPTLPSQQRILNRNNGTIYDGNGLMRQGPNPSRTLPGWNGGW
jgi:hypothetical protein